MNASLWQNNLENRLYRLLQNINRVPGLFLILLPLILFLTGIVFLVVKLKNYAYDNNFIISYRPKRMTIGIGNLTLGGSGKTPLVIYLVDFLKSQNINSVLVARGYKGLYNKSEQEAVSFFSEVPLFDPKVADTDWWDNFQVPSEKFGMWQAPSRKVEGQFTYRDRYSNFLGAMAELFGDEVAIYRHRFPDERIFVGKKKYQVVETLDQDVLLRHNPVLIVDDSFQHRALEPHLNLLVLLEKDLISRSNLMPLGHLREGFDSITRCDGILIRGQKPLELQMAFLKQKLRADLVPLLDDGSLPLFRADFIPTKIRHVFKSSAMDPLSFNKENTVFVASIANPSSFKNSLRQVGIYAKSICTFPDHYLYKWQDVENFWKPGMRILTTEKDLVKLMRFPQIQDSLYFVESEFKVVEGETEFHNLLLQAINKNRALNQKKY